MLIIDRYVKEYKNYDGKLEGAYQILFVFKGYAFLLILKNLKSFKQIVLQIANFQFMN